jgi:uncharacterized protein (DUF433 family)
MIDWTHHIHSDTAILVGKPVFRGTRLSVEFILGLYEAGWTETQILESYPQLNQEKLRALFAFMQECLKEEFIYIR